MNNEAIQGILEIVKMIFKSLLQYWWIFIILFIVAVVTGIINQNKKR